jgi:hypothetical protein
MACTPLSSARALKKPIRIGFFDLFRHLMAGGTQAA